MIELKFVNIYIQFLIRFPDCNFAPLSYFL